VSGVWRRSRAEQLAGEKRSENINLVYDLLLWECLYHVLSSRCRSKINLDKRGRLNKISKSFGGEQCHKHVIHTFNQCENTMTYWMHGLGPEVLGLIPGPSAIFFYFATFNKGARLSNYLLYGAHGYTQTPPVERYSQKLGKPISAYPDTAYSITSVRGTYRVPVYP